VVAITEKRDERKQAQLTGKGLKKLVLGTMKTKYSPFNESKWGKKGLDSNQLEKNKNEHRLEKK